MADLAIEACDQLGPLSVEIFILSGEVAKHAPIVLSSTRPKVIVTLAEGTYALIGTKPTGDRIVERVELQEQGAAVWFRPGERSTVQQWKDKIQPRSLRQISAERRVENVNTRRRWSSGRRLIGHWADFFHRTPSHFIREWRFVAGRWAICEEPIRYKVGDGFVQVSFRDRRLRALALQDENGYGPVVIVPPFKDGADVAFFADGIAEGEQTDDLPKTQAEQKPTAIALLTDTALGEILEGLNAPSLPGADQLWTNLASARWGTDSVRALDMLLNDDEPAAILCAHFLLRFNSQQASEAWFRKLAERMPTCADAAVLLAWKLAADGEPNNPDYLHSQIQECLHDAQRRPFTLFARSRGLLTQAIRLYGLAKWKDSPRQNQDMQYSPGDFVNAATIAGGVEAFWGISPDLPGHYPKDPNAQVRGTPVKMKDGMFVE